MIQCRQVCKTYRDTGTAVFHEFDMEILPGELVLLTGESGIGKTTLFKLISLEETPDCGEIRVAGKNLSSISRKQLPYFRRQIGFVFQDFRLIPDQTIYENMATAHLVMGGRAQDKEARIASLLRMMQVDHLHRRYPEQLSGGEQQRVCMARALLGQPQLLLADEPTGNLDPDASRSIMLLFRQIQLQGTTVVIATHDVRSAEGLPYREISLDR